MNRKHALGAIVAAALVAAGLWVWRTNPEATVPKDLPKATHTDEADAEPGVKLSPEARERAGIQVTDVRAAQRQGQVLAIATVLPIQELIDAASAIAAARAQAERADAALDASRRDHERIEGLHAQDRNASDRALETAEATRRADEASAKAASAAVQATLLSAKARWGGELTQALATHGRPWSDLESGRQVLLRVTLAAGPAPTRMPPLLDVELLSRQLRRAKLLAPSPTADARIQGSAYFYVMDSAGVSGGQTLQAHLAAGPKQDGAVLPAASLLWWQGKQWAYVEEEPGRFERREAADAWRVEGGWFVPGFEPGKVASQGAQSLLSQELRATVKVGEDDK